jgi:hypothetical protein
MVFSYNRGVHGRFSCCWKTHLITGGAPLLIVVPRCGSSTGKLSRRVEGSSIRFLDRFSGKAKGFWWFLLRKSATVKQKKLCGSTLYGYFCDFSTENYVYTFLKLVGC